MVKVYDDIIPDKICEILISTFEKNKEAHEYIDDNNCPCFTQVNVNTISKNIVRIVTPFIKKVYNQYVKDTQSKYIPPFESMEEYRIKRYLTNGDEKFDEHVDVFDFETSIRALGFLFYLNSNDGNTLFPSHNLNIKPISGRVVVFPPTWEYPHLGLPPKNYSKYIMSTYVHYGEN